MADNLTGTGGTARETTGSNQTNWSPLVTVFSPERMLSTGGDTAKTPWFHSR